MSDQKQCPFCGRQIAADADKCLWCGKLYDPNKAEFTQPTTPVQPEVKQPRTKNFLNIPYEVDAIIGLILGIAGLLFIVYYQTECKDKLHSSKELGEMFATITVVSACSGFLIARGIQSIKEHYTKKD